MSDVYIRVFGRRKNVWVDLVCEELDARKIGYDFSSEFDWARDAECNALEHHFDEERELTLIQKMPTILLEGVAAHWMIESGLIDPVTRWYGHRSGQYWITGVNDCLEFIRGANW